MTFSQCVKAYYEQHATSWRSRKHRVQFRSSLETYAIPLIGSRPVSAINTAEVLRVLEQPVTAAPAGPLWTARPETANRVRGRIEVVLNWAQVRGQRSGENPAKWRGHLDQVSRPDEAPRNIMRPSRTRKFPHSCLPRPETFQVRPLARWSSQF